MMGQGRRFGVSFWIEGLFGIAILVGIAYAMWVLYHDGYLPQPFFYEPSDTWMDWFNTAYWARDRGTYDNWGTIYPPLSFVVLWFLGNSTCYVGNEGLAVRDCDWIGVISLHMIFLLNIVLVAKSFIKIDRRTALPRSIALAAGMPMLFALERGNILLLCFTCVVLAFGPLIASARVRWLFAGLAVNFKVYIFATIVAMLLKRRWRWVEGACLSVLGVYLVSYALLGVGTPFEIYHNISTYAQGFEASQVLDIWYSITYNPLISLLQGKNFPIVTLIGSDIIELGIMIVPVFIRFGQSMILLAALATWLRPEVVSTYRVALLGTTMALISSEAGGYTQILVLFFLFMEPWRGFARPFALICGYLLCIPADISIGYVPPLLRDSFFAGHVVQVQFGVGLGMFVRPGLLILIGVALSASTIRDVWLDVTSQGWRHRWRFRQDTPLLPGVARPIPHES